MYLCLLISEMPLTFTYWIFPSYFISHKNQPTFSHPPLQPSFVITHFFFLFFFFTKINNFHWFFRLSTFSCCLQTHLLQTSSMSALIVFSKQASKFSKYFSSPTCIFDPIFAKTYATELVSRYSNLSMTWSIFLISLVVSMIRVSSWLWWSSCMLKHEMRKLESVSTIRLIISNPMPILIPRSRAHTSALLMLQFRCSWQRRLRALPSRFLWLLQPRLSPYLTLQLHQY